jgi:hypothetical protein
VSAQGQHTRRQDCSVRQVQGLHDSRRRQATGVADRQAEESRCEEVEEGGREITAMTSWLGDSPFSILILVLYVLFQYGFPALLVWIGIWSVLKARERRRVEEIQKHVNVTRQVKEMLRRDTTR